MLRDKHTEFEISKLQKQLDRKKATTVTTKVTNVTNPTQPETVLSKPVADDMTVVDGQTLVYNEKNKRWEPGNNSGSTDLSNYYDKDEVDALIPDVSDKADKTNVLELDNTTAFTPDADYEPATKKYVDDNGGGLTQPQIMARSLGC